jgi:hypothetical protein
MTKYLFSSLDEITDHRTSLKVLRGGGVISPIEYARLMHDCDVAQRDLTNPAIRDLEARVARSTLHVIRGGRAL